MQLVLKMVLLLIITALPLFGEAPRLMLYFDINKTLIASDIAGGKSMDNVLNHLLAEKFQYCWDPSIQEPLSYYDYVKNVLLPGPEYDSELKSRRKVYLDHFKDNLQTQNHALYPEVQKTYNIAMDALQRTQSIVFPSFYRLLEELDDRGLAYTIVLRSFGTEVHEIAQEINTVYKHMFRDFGEFRQGTLYLDEKKVSDSFEIYQTLSSLSHVSLRDDWSYWNKGEMESRYGKPFILDQEDSGVLELFFDDNIDLHNDEKNIIAPKDAKTGASIPVSELAVSHQIICVDTLEAIVDENYFVNLVQRALDIKLESSTK